MELGSATWSPNGGGFLDFADINQRKAHETATVPITKPRTASLVDDLVWRLQHQSLFMSTPCIPGSISYLIQKVLLSHWTLSLAFFQRDFNSVDLTSLTDASVSRDHTREVLADRESSRSPLDRSLYLLSRNSAENTSSPSRKPGQASTAAMELQKLLQADLNFVKDEIDAFNQDSERMINIRMLNLTIGDSKRDIEDSMRAEELSLRSHESAEQVNQLTGLGQVLLLIYTPVATA